MAIANDSTHPANMTPEERLAEVAAILAEGVLRLRRRSAVPASIQPIKVLTLRRMLLQVRKPSPPSFNPAMNVCTLPAVTSGSRSASMAVITRVTCRLASSAWSMVLPLAISIARKSATCSTRGRRASARNRLTRGSVRPSRISRGCMTLWAGLL